VLHVLHVKQMRWLCSMYTQQALVVGDYETDPTVMLEDVPQDNVLKTLKASCACVAVFVCVCVCVCGVLARRLCVRENLYLHFRNFVCVCVQLYCSREGTSHTSSRVDGRLE
jgi:hypothetical protein